MCGRSPGRSAVAKLRVVAAIEVAFASFYSMRGRSSE
jgi:hypothetical protein